MYIIDTRSIDKQGRVTISGLFEKTPEEIIVAFNTETKRIDILDSAQTPFRTSSTQKVDAKNRISIPSWLRKEIEPICDPPPRLYLAIDDQNKPCLIVKTEKLF